MKHTLSYALYAFFLPLLPWLKRQARHVRRDALRLPDAIGHAEPPSNGAPYFLHLGESTVAGVGVEHIHDGFTAQLAQQLQQRHQQSIAWQHYGITGITANGLLKKLSENDAALPSLSEQPPALLIITLGVNDTTGMTSNRRWQTALDALVQRVANEQTHVVFTQIPPMHAFPALPSPLNWFLGLRAWQLDQQLRQECARHGWQYLAMTGALEPQWMAADGYHPNAQGYRRWAEDAAARLHWSPSSDSPVPSNTTNDRAAL